MMRRLRAKWAVARATWLRSPWIQRRKHEALQALHSRMVELLREENEAERVRLQDLIAKLIRVKAWRDQPSNTFRCEVSFSDEFVYQCFVHGEDQAHIEYVAKMLARQVERELRTINFARFRDYPSAPSRGQRIG